MDNPWKRYSKINPQREDGHREIVSGVYRALIKADLTGGEYKIAFSIIEKTWGFNKTSDQISISQFVEMTNLSQRMVNLAIKSLKQKRIIYYEPSKRYGMKCGSPLNEFILNKHYDTWLAIRVKRSSGVKQNVNKGEIECKNGVNHIADTINKEPIKTSTIKTPPTPPKGERVSLPEFISPNTWADFCEHRKAMKAKLTPKASELIFKKLAGWKEQNGWNPDDILNQSIERGWRGVFGLKDNGNGNNTAKTQDSGRYREVKADDLLKKWANEIGGKYDIRQ